ncbi:MAG TPA: hypothetical protein VNO30_36850 [Kofleriaceae bacterium]|nr:hypothetical protein [Kofleriaceae bacterium]
MSEAGALVAAAWRDGVDADDRARLDAAGGAVDADDRARLDAAGGADPELALFAAACRLICGQPAALPPPPADPAAAVVHAAAAALAAALARDVAALERAAAQLGEALAELAPNAPRALAAHAWADLALGEIARATGDRRVAHQRYTAAAAPGRPVALRLAAMSRLVELAVERRDLATARDGARKAALVAEAHGRRAQAARARLAGGLLDYAAGDLAAMRESLGARTDEPIARVLLATAEPAERALPLLAEALRDAAARGDALIYALCIQLGVRRYRALGRDDDARTLLVTGIAQLAGPAPALAEVLAELTDRATPA